MERFDRIFTKVCDRIALYFSGFVIFIMMFYVAGNVFFRYALGRGGIIGCYEYVGIMLVPLVYMGLSYGWYKKAYVVVDILQKRLKGKTLWNFQFAFLVITLLFFIAILFYGVLTDTILSYTKGLLAGSPGYYLPEWPWKATMVIGVFLMIMRNILDMIAMVRTGQVIPDSR